LSEARRIADQHRRAYHGDAWHGPAVFELLRGVNASRAAAHPIRGAHSIWELVLHLTTWELVVRSRVIGSPIAVDRALDWPAPGPPTARAWREARAALEVASDALHTAVAKMTDQKLRAKRPRTSGTYYELVHGQVQHALYHAGQIAILRKAR
jgi:uncharacterized damage-inducible protein DinB